MSSTSSASAAAQGSRDSAPKAGLVQRFRTLFSAKPEQAAGAKRKPRVLFLVLIVAVGAALVFFLRRRSNSKKTLTESESEEDRPPRLADGVRQIRYWKRRPDWDSPLTLTLIESSDGLQLLDEADPYGNGVITLYLPKSQSKGGKRCFSLVRQKAVIYQRQNYEALKTDCVTTFKMVKRDFKDEIPVTLTLHSLPRPGFEGIVDYLKESQVLLS